ncbi:MAG: hypothetical protein V4653_10555 [Pseudomonadota bacterium]
MKPHRIERLYAWIATDADGEDGIPAFQGPEGMMPLVGSDKVRIESLRSVAEQLVALEGYPVRLVEFTSMVVLETLPGSATPQRHR